jgi:uncharacterized protein YprB with RNaseH-like and TPR domain
MLENTFVHLPKIGYETERKIWNEGLKTWNDFINKEHRWNALKPWILESKRNLIVCNFKFFKSLLPKRDWWRCYHEFKARTIFLDIETDPERITTVGIYDGKNYNYFISGKNLETAIPAILKSALIVTYNGTGFDLPHLRAELKLNIDSIHLDLMYLLRRLGLKGGLKKIEKEVGIKRDKEIESLSGWDAVWLWNDYKGGNSRALETLIKYNTADVVNLKKLLEFAYRKLKNQLLSGAF